MMLNMVKEGLIFVAVELEKRAEWAYDMVA